MERMITWFIVLVISVFITVYAVKLVNKEVEAIKTAISVTRVAAEIK